jgi:hypothetical protein
MFKKTVIIHGKIKPKLAIKPNLKYKSLNIFLYFELDSDNLQTKTI